MERIQSNLFNLQYFLGGKTKVNSLKEGAIKFGGATKFEQEIYSNKETDGFIKINEDKNNISIFVPSTINIDEVIDNTPYVMNTLKKLQMKYSLKDMKFYNTEGSWYDDKGNTVVIEKITIITVEMIILSLNDIEFFIGIANEIKHNMNQQAVSININDSLAIV